SEDEDDQPVAPIEAIQEIEYRYGDEPVDPFHRPPAHIDLFFQPISVCFQDLVLVWPKEEMHGVGIDVLAVEIETEVSSKQFHDCRISAGIYIYLTPIEAILRNQDIGKKMLLERDPLNLPSELFIIVFGRV